MKIATLFGWSGTAKSWLAIQRAQRNKKVKENLRFAQIVYGYENEKNLENLSNMLKSINNLF